MPNAWDGASAALLKRAGFEALGSSSFAIADAARPTHDFDAAVARMRAAALSARRRILLTGRTDNFLNGRPDLDDTIRRLTAFAEVGADVLEAPGLRDIEAIHAVVRAVAPKPVNVLTGRGARPLRRELTG